MKAPDKVFVHTGKLSLLCASIINITGNDTEYIRKDAILEWANKRLEEFRHIAEISNDVAADGEVDAFEELIDKLNSM